MDEKVRAHLMISGRVQGVFYRMETQRAAGRLGVTGWVRNKPNGMVEAVATGEKKAVDALIQWCRTGPPASVLNMLKSPGCRIGKNSAPLTSPMMDEKK